ncbi:MAG: FprA family A-type flavoprotein [Clostridia bacterium]|nr:FprA family A-type flavoprotein [Clostridia bacterium]
MALRKVTDDILYLGADDNRLALFENVYPLPNGVTYNSYLVLDEQTVLMDTVDRAAGDIFFRSLKEGLNGRALDYVVVHHMEPDHAGTLNDLLALYPDAKVVMTKKAQAMFGQFFDADISARVIPAAEGSTLSTGRHTFTFLTAPMVHWPEVMVSFDSESGILFSADAFGTFGSLHGALFADEIDFERDFLAEARRYYCNIVGKYGTPVQTLLKKAAALDIKTICPLHGPVWRKDLDRLVGLYDGWSKYQPEDRDVVLFVGSVYGHTEEAAQALGKALAERGVKNVRLYDVAKTHVSTLLAEAFRAKVAVFAASTYNNGIFTPMEGLLLDLKAHDWQKRSFALIENGSWAPNAGKLMAELLGSMKNLTQLGPTLTLKSALKPAQLPDIDALADQICAALSTDEAEG